MSVVTSMADHLYDFLPANPNPFADAGLSFPGCATKCGLGPFWPGGSKRPAVSNLLASTLEYKRDRFCTLIVEIVNASMIYRANKGIPISRSEMEVLNEMIKDVGFKIPVLWDTTFLRSLAGNAVEQVKSPLPVLSELKKECIALNTVEPHKRGYAFQELLNKIFVVFDLNPKAPFRIKGEEMDGSVDVQGTIYLVEAKWHSDPVSENELLIFSGKVTGKAQWSRGLFISYSGFTSDALYAFGQGKSTNLIGMNAQDLFFILDEKMTLVEAIKAKARYAAEKNGFFVSVYDLITLYGAK